MEPSFGAEYPPHPPSQYITYAKMAEGRLCGLLFSIHMEGIPLLIRYIKAPLPIFVDPPLSLWLCHRKWLILYFLKL